MSRKCSSGEYHNVLYCIISMYLCSGYERNGVAILWNGGGELYDLQQGLHGRVWHQGRLCRGDLWSNHPNSRKTVLSSCVHDWLKVLNMDPDVMAMLQKSISAKVISWRHLIRWSPTNVILSSNQLCPTVIGQACMDVVVNPPREGDPSFSSWKSQVCPVT